MPTNLDLPTGTGITKSMGVATGNFENMGAEFARRAMMEIPIQHEYIRKHMGVM